MFMFSSFSFSSSKYRSPSKNHDTNTYPSDHEGGMNRSRSTTEISSLHFGEHLLKRVKAPKSVDTSSVVSGFSDVLRHQKSSFHAKKKRKAKTEQNSLLDVIHDVQSVSLVFHDLVLKLGSKSQQQSFQTVRDTYLTLFERALKVVLAMDDKREVKLGHETKTYNSLHKKIGNELKHLKERNKALIDACTAKDVVARLSDSTIKDLEEEVHTV